jgi:hypothetical protein
MPCEKQALNDFALQVCLLITTKNDIHVMHMTHVVKISYNFKQSFQKG